MNCLLALVMVVAPADQAKTDPQPLEEALAAGVKPGGDKPVMVQTHILVHSVNGKHGMSVKFVDAKDSPNVNIKVWDKKLSDLKPETTLKVTGQLHFGPVSGGTPSIRYKVREQSGKKYNDHRHWRTDRAIYIINPTYEIAEEKKNDDKPGT